MGNNITGIVHSPRYAASNTASSEVSTDTSQVQDKANLAKSIIQSNSNSTQVSTAESSNAVLSQVDQVIAKSEESEPMVKKESFPTSLDEIKGLSSQSMNQLAATDDMIQNQLAKYEKMAQENDAPEIKRKITFWKHQQGLQEKIKERLKNQGLAGEHLKKAFTNFFNARTKLLSNKAKQGPYADNKAKFYEYMEKNTAILTQLASGSSWKRVESNMHLVNSMAKKVGTRYEAIEKLTDSINKFKKELNKKGLNQKRRDAIKAKLEELHQKRNEQRTIRGQLLKIIRQFGGRSHKLTSIQKAQYIGALRDIEALKGDADLSNLP